MSKTTEETSERELTETVLKNGRELHLSMADGEYPYLVPLNYAYAAGCIYIHSGRVGKKIDCLRRNPRVCFAVNEVVERIGGEKACQWSTRFRSVIGYGRARVSDDREDKIKGYDALMAQFRGPIGGYEEKYLQGSLMICIEIEKLSGKRSEAYDD